MQARATNFLYLCLEADVCSLDFQISRWHMKHWKTETTHGDLPWGSVRGGDSRGKKKNNLSEKNMILFYYSLQAWIFPHDVVHGTCRNVPLLLVYLAADIRSLDFTVSRWNWNMKHWKLPKPHMGEDRKHPHDRVDSTCRNVPLLLVYLEAHVCSLEFQNSRWNMKHWQNETIRPHKRKRECGSTFLSHLCQNQNCKLLV